jgi:mannosyl-oligosaccharide alpha-1,2-mannosidase
MYKITKKGLAPEIVWLNPHEADLEPTPDSSMRQFPPSNDSLAPWKEDYNVEPEDSHNLQRPETVESLLIMWQITKVPIYQEWRWKIFKAFEYHKRIDDGEGHSSLNDVNSVPLTRQDSMESFWLVRKKKNLN